MGSNVTWGILRVAQNDVVLGFAGGRYAVCIVTARQGRAPALRSRNAFVRCMVGDVSWEILRTPCFAGAQNDKFLDAAVLSLHGAGGWLGDSSRGSE